MDRNQLKEKIKRIVKSVINEVLINKRNNDNGFGTNTSNDYELVGTFISSLIDDSTLSMVGENKVGEYVSFTVYVLPRDNGYVPHVHIVLTNEIGHNKKTFDCCVKLETNEYFKHGCHQSVFNSRQSKDFNTFMNEINKLGITNYKYAVFLWDNNNERVQVTTNTDNDGSLVVPNYNMISE